ncbi:hypothetical protein C0213_03140 [Latilactobacillus sakei]|nr:hypothetical protein [Latilactobacillus sakei]AUX11442.1 hypothetical protein C0213_03140 [Latilactobacillus sakei]
MENNDKLLKKIKLAYDQQLDYIGVKDAELNRFMWSAKKKIQIYMYEVFSNVGTVYIIFAIESSKDELIEASFVTETHNYEFESLFITEERFNYLANQNLIEPNLKNKVNPNSIYATFPLSNSVEENLLDWVKSFVSREYNNSKNMLEQKNITQQFPLLNKKIFIDKYHFNEMLSVINNNQFSDEFNQCLFAYENQKWFLCAAGIGSTLEHLMLLILTNYGVEKSLGRNPTAKDYLKAFTKEPILLESRQQTYIDTLFRLRNSVDHHNSGYTSKGICDMLLDGISAVFNEYYITSLKNQH